MARVDTLGHFLTDVADAIRTKGGTSEPIQASSFDTAIVNLPSGDVSAYYKDLPTTALNSTDTLGRWYKLVKKLPPIKLAPTSNSLTSLFQNCPSEVIEFTNDTTTSTVKTMNQMFLYCSQVKTLDLTMFNTSIVTTLANMFDGCSNLETINLTGFNTANVTSMASLFNGNSKLVSANLSTFTAKASVDMSKAFYNCTHLEHLDMRAFDFTIASIVTSATSSGTFRNVPTTVEIIVADQTQKDWFTTNMPSFTNVKTVAEYEG